MARSWLKVPVLGDGMARWHGTGDRGRGTAVATRSTGDGVGEGGRRFGIEDGLGLSYGFADVPFEFVG